MAEQKGKRQIPIVCPGHTRPLAELQFTYVKEEDRTFLVSACHDKLPMLRDGATGDWIGTFSGHKGAVWCCRLDPSGSLAATASGDFSVKVWDAITGKSLFEFPHKHIVKTCDFSPDSKRLATGGHEGLVRIYNLTAEGQEPRVLQEDNNKVAISKCNWVTDELLLAADADGVIRFWKVSEDEGEAPEVLDTIKVDAEVRDMELVKLADGQLILTIAAGNKVSFFDSNTKELIHAYTMPIHFRDEGGASLHPAGKRFVAGGSDLWVRVFDFDNGQELECLKGHHGPIRCLRYAPDGKTYATGSEDGTIRLWKTFPEDEEVQ
mmetsp:Transcript_31766/g.46853  ORF Transcript_31766/g.46853 Transcript_31766/m.46853 type:complete len:321 (+) Transcript_31766:108-1070(+)|eukprot:CAMPEP_0194199802 /NCGR_PEP_ID=MMETSP0156-20130528/681_1 /TAXON_ID=33649 /ORGANISM="Thalassionema nitzschioides, Strain L26-B" /LENGTH=320 /DNA_ID=CAMNT_0038924741 /DNA_START=80 /DNA_END=1042 /DNA_ORIENTATION=+